MTKNIIVCCDGTGNQIGSATTNVLKLFRCLRRGKEQVVFYDPGVGTIAGDNGWNRFRKKFMGVLGLATGWGLDDGILRAYRFIAENYHEGDRIYLFGFSRGAYTARAVAGLINGIGLIWPQQSNLADYGLTTYKSLASVTGASPDFKKLGQFQRFAGGRAVPIEFIGVWDTVSSIFVPWSGPFLLPSKQWLLFTDTNRYVRTFRQAMAIDERRCMFRLNRWEKNQKTVVFPLTSPLQTADQDARQLWFAGVHADVGGGYPEEDAALAKFPLLWMVQEARDAGVLIDQRNLDHLTGRTVDRETNSREYPREDANGMLHDSMNGAWPILEWWPKKNKLKEWKERRSLLGLYLPRAEPRVIPPGAMVHVSVRDRMDNPDNKYKPVNLPGNASFVER